MDVQKHVPPRSDSRHCRATAPGCLIENGRRERLPYKILRVTISETMDAQKHILPL